MTQLTEEQRAVCAYLRKRGRTLESIAAEVGCSTSTVRKWVISSAQGRGVRRKGRVVEQRLIDATAAKRAVQLLKSDEVGGAGSAAKQLFREGRVPCLPSRQTVVRAAKQVSREGNDPLMYCTSLPKKGLTAVTKKKRVNFCRANANRDWSKVMFTDRCKFHFRFPGSKVRQGRWLNKSEKAEYKVFTPSHPQCYNVYGGITRHGTTRLVPVAGTDGQSTRYYNKKGEQAKNITAQEYGVVVGEHFLPEGEALFSTEGVREWVLQQDRDPTHTAAHPAVEKHNALGRSCVDVLPDWPGNSPDLNPIENVWSTVLDRVQRTGCTDFSEFKRRVNREFRMIGEDKLKHYYEDMPKRMRECLARNGDKLDC